MVDDLLRKHDLVGKSRADILGLLGPPDSGDEGNQEAQEFYYYLGQMSSGERASLLIQFDDNRVISARTYIT
jgi:hypothetical protein